MEKISRRHIEIFSLTFPEKRLTIHTRVDQKVLPLGSYFFSATFYQTYLITNIQSIPPLLKHIFVTFLPSREKQISSLLLVSVGYTDK